MTVRVTAAVTTATPAAGETCSAAATTARSSALSTTRRTTAASGRARARGPHCWGAGAGGQSGGPGPPATGAARPAPGSAHVRAAAATVLSHRTDSVSQDPSADSSEGFNFLFKLGLHTSEAINQSFSTKEDVVMEENQKL